MCHPHTQGLFSLPCSFYNIPTFCHWFIPAWLVVTFFAGFGTTCSSKTSIAFGNVLSYLIVLACLYLHMLVQARQQRKVPGGVVYKFVFGPFFAWWHGKHDGGPAAEMKILIAGQIVGVPCMVIAGLLYLATSGPNIFARYCDSFFANIWAGIFSYNLFLLVLLFAAPYYPFEGGRFWVCWCYNKGKSKVETLQFIEKISIPCAAFLCIVGIVALATNAINGDAYLLCGIWGIIQTYQLHQLLQRVPADGELKHSVLNVCIPCDGKIPPEAAPAEGGYGYSDDVPYAAPVASPVPQPQGAAANEGNPFTVDATFGAPTQITQI